MTQRGRRMLIGIAIVAAFGASAAAWLVRQSPAPVNVTVVNSTQRTIVAAWLEHEHGNELLPSIQPGQTRVARFEARGESSYRLTVRFADGAEVRGQEQYAESGYEFVETVGDSGITSDVRLPSY